MAAVSSVGASWAPQMTLKDNHMPVQTSVITFPALPAAPTWASIARINVPAGQSSRINSYKECIKCHLCFDYGCGVTTVGDVTNIAVNAIQILNSFRSIELQCQEQSLFLLDNGCLTQTWMANIINKYTVDVTICYHISKGCLATRPVMKIQVLTCS